MASSSLLTDSLLRSLLESREDFPSSFSSRLPRLPRSSGSSHIEPCRPPAGLMEVHSLRVGVYEFHIPVCEPWVVNVHLSGSDEVYSLPGCPVTYAMLSTILEVSMPDAGAPVEPPISESEARKLLQELDGTVIVDLDAVAVGYNPHKFTNLQVGAQHGWRLLHMRELQPSREHTREDGIEWWNPHESEWTSSFARIAHYCDGRHWCFRTKNPDPAKA